MLCVIITVQTVCTYCVCRLGLRTGQQLRRTTPQSLRNGWCRSRGTNWTRGYFVWTRYPPIVILSHGQTFPSNATRASRHQTRIHSYPVRHAHHGINTQAVIDKRLEIAGTRRKSALLDEQAVVLKRRAAVLDEELVLLEDRAHTTKHMRRTLGNALRMQKIVDIPEPDDEPGFLEPLER